MFARRLATTTLEIGIGSIDAATSTWGTTIAVVLSIVLAVASYLERRQGRVAPEADYGRRHAKVDEEQDAPLIDGAEKRKVKGFWAAVWADPQTRECAILSITMLVWSGLIIYVNAYILDDLCPYPATLTMFQQAFGFACAYACIYGFRACEPVDMAPQVWAKYMIPMGACFAIYLWGGNKAYLYISPGFMQMLKPIAGPITFGVSCAHDPAEYTHWKLVVQRAGFEIKLNPLTTLLYVGPVSTFFLIVVAASTEWDADFDCFAEGKLTWWLLLCDCVVAFGFNYGMLQFIGKLSAVSYTIFGLFKDIALVVAAFLFFEAPPSSSSRAGP
ncbi:hypothetical protein JL720_14190 [Aureococcus anophagefferens]|nr:hypothetical protein JL720_14190 [Aureococcus anophagefferens]